MTRMAGDKDVFGVEFDLISRDRYAMGRMRVWIEGRYIGAFDDVDMLNSLQFQFKGRELEIPDGCEFLGKPAEDIFGLINEKAPEDVGRYVFSPAPLR